MRLPFMRRDSGMVQRMSSQPAKSDQPSNLVQGPWGRYTPAQIQRQLTPRWGMRGVQGVFNFVKRCQALGVSAQPVLECLMSARDPLPEGCLEQLPSQRRIFAPMERGACAVRGADHLRFGPGIIYHFTKDLQHTLATGMLEPTHQGKPAFFTRNPAKWCRFDLHKNVDHCGILVLDTSVFNQLMDQKKARMQTHCSSHVWPRICEALPVSAFREIWIPQQHKAQHLKDKGDIGTVRTVAIPWAPEDSNNCAYDPAVLRHVLQQDLWMKIPIFHEEKFSA